MFSFTTLDAQQIEGIYRLSGGHEMVAAFQFKKDSSFEFYFIYGAVDRSSRGHYTIRNGYILLHSEKTAGRDFTVVRKEIKGDGTTLKITDPNPALIRNVAGIFKKETEEDMQYSNSEGVIHTSLNNCDSVMVIHTLFPDVPTQVKKDAADKNNFFELILNPSLAEISFRDFVLTISEGGLTGSLPYLFERDKAVFIKEKE